jgi:hypothetical protein
MPEIGGGGAAAAGPASTARTNEAQSAANERDRIRAVSPGCGFES